MNIPGNYISLDESQLLQLMAEGDDRAFTIIYRRYWKTLFAYVYNGLHSKVLGEEVVQEIFFSLWTKRKELNINSSLKNYLFVAAKNGMLNALRSEKTRGHYAKEFSTFMQKQYDNSNDELNSLKDLEGSIETIVLSLPERCQKIFRLSRQQHLSIQQIAIEMNISQKTVENQLTLALRYLRSSLKVFIAFVLFFRV